MTAEDAGTRLTELLEGRNLGPSHADAVGRTVLTLVGGGSLHFRNSSLIETAGVTGGKVARVDRTDGRLTLIFSNGHYVVYPLADGPGAVAVLSPDGIALYEE